MEKSNDLIEDTSLHDEESDLVIASKNWNRIVETASTMGYKEGIENGQESVFQQGFDIGYSDGFQIAFVLGKYKSLNAPMLKNVQQPKNISSILEQTRRNICHICEVEQKQKISNAQNIEELPFKNILKMQRMNYISMLEKLHKHVEPIIELRGVNIEELNF